MTPDEYLRLRLNACAAVAPLVVSQNPDYPGNESQILASADYLLQLLGVEKPEAADG